MYSGGLTFVHGHQVHSDCVNGSTRYMLVQNFVNGLLSLHGVQSFKHIANNGYKIFAITAINGYLTVCKLCIKQFSNLTRVQSTTPFYFQLSNTASMSLSFCPIKAEN